MKHMKKNPFSSRDLNLRVYRLDIIQSLADIDAYKLHMAQVAFEKHPTAIAKYRFVCRSDENLLPYMAEIRTEITKLEKLRFSDKEIAFFHNRVPWLKANFIESLRDLTLKPRQHVKVFDDNGQLGITAEGGWLQTIWYEIYILAIVSEVRNRNRFPNLPHEKFREVLYTKIKKLKRRLKEENLEDYFHFMEFGTRRRASYHIQNDAIQILMNELPDNFAGTSNYLMAMEHDIPFHGTMAHEYIQAFQSFGNIQNHQTAALETWDDVFRGSLGIALTDTITSDAFILGFDRGLANRFDGLRQDSGCPFVWGDKMIAHYDSLGVDSRTKKLVFTDGLDFDKAIEIIKYFKDRAIIVFGIGTSITNDLGDYCNEKGELYKALSIVMKLVRMNGQPVAKISDEPAKSICDCPFYLANLKVRFNVPFDINQFAKDIAKHNKVEV